MSRTRSLALLSLVAVLCSGCWRTTDSNQVAVITNKGFLGDKGVRAEFQERGTLEPVIGVFHDWHPFVVSQQKIEMVMTNRRGPGIDDEDLTFKTIDGNDVSLDLIVTYSIIPDRTPFILQNVAMNDEELRENVIRTVCRSIPRDLFGELDTEEFYVAAERSKKAEEVRAKLNEILEPYGVRVDSVGPQDYRFNREYQKAIEDKKIADQQVEKNRSAAKAVEEEYLRKIEEARGEVAQVKARADGEFERAKIEADAYYIQQQRLAEAIEAEGRAEAEAIQKMNEALAGSGGENIVKMAIAQALQGKRIIVLPMGGGGLDVRSTDINSLLQLYGIQQITGQPSGPR